MERRALGKGIGALIPNREQETGAQTGVLFVQLEKIKPSPFQPRANFDDHSLGELAQSIKEKGIIQPVVVRRNGDFYELIAGERRFRAANLLKLKEIPVIVKDVDDLDSLEIALIENIQRESLNPIEEARAYQFLIDKFSVTHEKISEVLGKARASITNTLRLLSLPIEIQDEIKKGRISFAHGRALLEIEDPHQQRRLAGEAISKSLSLRELENLIKSQKRKASKRKAAPGRDPYLVVLEEELQQILATKVSISKRKKRGHILIEFFSQEELERIIKKLRG